MNKQNFQMILTFKEWLLEKHGMSYNAFLSLVSYVQSDLVKDYEAYRLNGSSPVTAYGKYSERNKPEKNVNLFELWLNKRGTTLSTVKTLPMKKVAAIYNKFWSETYDV